LRLEDVYRSVVNTGIKNDPRPKKEVQGLLSRNKREFRSLKGKKRSLFDKDSLFNPYNDTRILYGDREKEIRSIMVGIDMETPELLLADRFNQMGSPVDLVITHHPGGRALAELYKVMGVQTDQLKRLGMNKEVAEELMGERMAEVARGLHAKNCMRNIDTAKILDIPYMCVHTASDNMVNTFLQKLMDKSKPKTLGAVVDLLDSIYEYKESAKIGIGPKILVGDRKKLAGKIYVDMTGGTEGSKNVFARLSQIGIGTLLCMHLSEAHYKQAKKEHINIIVAGHISSDNIGMNLIFDELIKKDDFSIMPCSGFRRFSRI